MQPIHNTLIRKEKSTVSTLFTCHIWLDKRIIICTWEGDILLAEPTGEFKMKLKTAPGFTFPITQIIPKQDTNGFLIASDKGIILLYEPNQNVKCPFRKADMLPKAVDETEPFHQFLSNQANFPHFKIGSMAMVGSTLVYTTKTGQLLKMKLLDKEEDVGKIAYLTEPFNEFRITGLCTCISKPTLVTTSDDCYLRLYTYATG
jgi:hypothetical protein